MIKTEEIANPTSCLNKAKPEEMLFVLLGRDPAAPVAIREWCKERVRLGKNKWTDPQIEDAIYCAVQMQPGLISPSPTT